MDEINKKWEEKRRDCRAAVTEIARDLKLVVDRRAYFVQSIRKSIPSAVELLSRRYADTCTIKFACRSFL